MGYTHYWTFNKNIRGRTDEVNAKYAEAIKQCNKIAFEYHQDCKIEDTEHYGRLSGFSAHTIGKYGGIHFNGTGDEAHEDFMLREHYKQNERDFCKTACKPYDIVVVACLSVLKFYLGDDIEVSSDGDRSEWAPGVKLARDITRMLVTNPIKREAA